MLLLPSPSSDGGCGQRWLSNTNTDIIEYKWLNIRRSKPGMEGTLPVLPNGTSQPSPCSESEKERNNHSSHINKGAKEETIRNEQRQTWWERQKKVDGDLLSRVVFSSKFGFCPGRQFAHREPGYSTLKLGFLLKRWTTSAYFALYELVYKGSLFQDNIWV